MDNSNLGIIIAVGMLTFVSIFFSFLYSSTELKLLFDKLIDKSTNKMKVHAIKKLKSGDLAGTRMTTVDIETVQSLKNWVNPTLWLHLSIFLYLFSIVFGFVSVGMSNNVLKITRDIQGISFYLGLTSTFFLYTSIICLTFILKQSKPQK